MNKSKPKKATKKKATKSLKNKIKKQRNAILNRSVKNYLKSVAGEYAVKIILNLYEPTTADDIAKKLNVRTSIVRAALNKLYDIRITQYSAVRDKKTKKKKYVWTIREDYLKALPEKLESK